MHIFCELICISSVNSYAYLLQIYVHIFSPNLYAYLLQIYVCISFLNFYVYILQIYMHIFSKFMCISLQIDMHIIFKLMHIYAYYLLYLCIYIFSKCICISSLNIYAYLLQICMHSFEFEYKVYIVNYFQVNSNLLYCVYFSIIFFIFVCV